MVEVDKLVCIKEMNVKGTNEHHAGEINQEDNNLIIKIG